MIVRAGVGWVNVGLRKFSWEDAPSLPEECHNLMAQDISQNFSVDPGVEEGTAIVHLLFGTETVRHLHIDMVQELGNWLIDSIRLAE